METNTIKRLQEWFSAQCDGDWEHGRGIEIENLDNPGWMVTIELTGTKLEEKDFSPCCHDRSEIDWLRCRLEGSQFCGYGGPGNLEEILITFLEWAERAAAS